MGKDPISLLVTLVPSWCCWTLLCDETRNDDPPPACFLSRACIPLQLPAVSFIDWLVITQREKEPGRQSCCVEFRTRFLLDLSHTLISLFSMINLINKLTLPAHTSISIQSHVYFYPRAYIQGYSCCPRSRKSTDTQSSSATKVDHHHLTIEYNERWHSKGTFGWREESLA